jgi:hypothetical protein
MSIFLSGFWGFSGGLGGFSKTTVADWLSGGIFTRWDGQGEPGPPGFTEFDGGGRVGSRSFFGPFGGFFPQKRRRKLGG